MLLCGTVSPIALLGVAVYEKRRFSVVRLLMDGQSPWHIEQFRIVPSIYKVSAPTIQRYCPSMRLSDAQHNIWPSSSAQQSSAGRVSADEIKRLHACDAPEVSETACIVVLGVSE